MTAKQRERCRERLQVYLAEMLAPWGRSERRSWGSVYVRGRLLDGERQSVGAMATRLPEANEQNRQQLLKQSPWAWEPGLARPGRAHRVFLPLPEAWVIDDTGFPKAVLRSPGQKGQLSGGGGLASPRSQRQLSARLSPVLAGTLDRGSSAIRYGEQRPWSVQEVARPKQRQFRALTWREGAKGPLRSRWWAGRVQIWLLIEWPKDAPEPPKYYLCNLPEELSRKRLVQMARGRGRVELDYQQRKEERGLDPFEGRSWTGWHHHVTLVE